MGTNSMTRLSQKWTNKERVLVFCQRGINYRARHLMLDLRTLMPHARADNKLDRKDRLTVINEVCEMKNCNKCVFFEMKKKRDLFMWVSNIPHGPSARFLVENIHTMDELKLTGNCLKGSRPIVSFDNKFDDSIQYRLLKELFTQIFSTPNQHPKSKPFIDHVINFTIVDNRIWMRNYQMKCYCNTKKAVNVGKKISFQKYKHEFLFSGYSKLQIINQNDMSMTEIGPRFVLNLIRIFDGSFGGATIFENPNYVSPNQHRRNIRKEAAFRYMNKQNSKEKLAERIADRESFVETSLDDIFHTVTQADINEARKKGK